MNDTPCKDHLSDKYREGNTFHQQESTAKLGHPYSNLTTLISFNKLGNSLDFHWELEVKHITRLGMYMPSLTRTHPDTQLFTRLDRITRNNRSLSQSAQWTVQSNKEAWTNFLFLYFIAKNKIFLWFYLACK